jgi:UDP:flavonoid glycosyltransferase YjiC (YdhE family)
MRLLFAFAGGTGHFNPLAPIAAAAVDAGHTVAFAGAPSLLERITAAGFTGFATGEPYLPPPSRLPLQSLDRDREDADLRDGFADRMARARYPAMVSLCRTWRPDAIVCDEADFGAMLAAESCDVPYATVIVMPSGSFVRAALVGATLGAVRADVGLPADPDMTMLHRHLVLSPAPPSFRDPAYPLPPTALSIRPHDPRPGPDETVPPWLTGPFVYVTLGTIFNMESGDLFHRVLAGVASLDVGVLVTVGPHIDPAEFGTWGPNVHIVRWMSQSLVLPRCAAMVSHAGSGSTIGGLAHGLPSVLLPMGADQPHNADRCAALGLGIVLNPSTATPPDIGSAVHTVLTDPSYRTAASAIRTEIASLPGPEHAIAALERLA